MHFWSHLSGLGGLDLTGFLALLIAVWTASTRGWRASGAWLGLFCAAMAIAALSQMAFIGWGVGVEAVSFTGFSGHATRAAAVYPVALFVAMAQRGRQRQSVAALLGILLAGGVAVARVRVGAHSPSEAAAGFCLGLATACLFMAATRQAGAGARLRPQWLGLIALILLLPRADVLNSHQLLTAASLALSGHDRAFVRQDWQRAQAPYSPPCAPERIRFTYACI